MSEAKAQTGALAPPAQTILVRTFERSRDPAEYRTMYRLDRGVLVDISGAFPGSSGRREDELPLWVKAGVSAWSHGCRPRQVAWIRRASADWLAVVLMPAGSANGQSQITMQLWLEPHLIATERAQTR